MSDRDDLIELLRANGLTNGGGSPHSWRCEYPERYGLCACADELVDDILTWVSERDGTF